MRFRRFREMSRELTTLIVDKSPDLGHYTHNACEIARENFSNRRLSDM
jgi:hypothetical protein